MYVPGEKVAGKCERDRELLNIRWAEGNQSAATQVFEEIR